jgi:hypothetical protein
MSSAGVPTKSLIAFWESILKEHQYLMEVSTGVLIKETINKLQKLDKLEEQKENEIQQS